MQNGSIGEQKSFLIEVGVWDIVSEQKKPRPDNRELFFASMDTQNTLATLFSRILEHISTMKAFQPVVLRLL